MAFTRKFLSALGIEADKVDEIINAHIEVVDGLKEERDNYKKSAEKLDDVQKKLDDANAKLAKKGEGETISREDFEKLQREYDDYREKVSAKEVRTAKEHAFREVLKAVGVKNKRIDSIVKVTDIDGIELEENGKIKESEKLMQTIKTEWTDFIEETNTSGANISNPPANNGKGVKTKEEIYKMENGRYVLSSSERQAELVKLYQSEKGD